MDSFTFKQDNLVTFIDICNKILKTKDKSQRIYIKYLYFLIGTSFSYELCMLIAEYIINDVHLQWQLTNKTISESLVLYDYDSSSPPSYMCISRDVFRWVMNWNAHSKCNFRVVHPLLRDVFPSDYYSLQDEMMIRDDNNMIKKIDERICRTIKRQWMILQKKIEDNDHNLVVFKNNRIKLDDSEFCGCIQMSSQPFLVINDIIYSRLHSFS